MFARIVYKTKIKIRFKNQEINPVMKNILTPIALAGMLILGSTHQALGMKKIRLDKDICSSIKKKNKTLNALVNAVNHGWTGRMERALNKVGAYGIDLNWVAFTQDNAQVVEILCENGAIVTRRTKNGDMPFHTACQNKHFKVAKALLDNPQQYNHADINATGCDGRTALFQACESGNLEAVKFLLENNALVDFIGKKTSAPLHIACLNGHFEIVKLLIHNKANINKLNGAQQTPLSLAKEKNHIQIVNFLIQNGAQEPIQNQPSNETTIGMSGDSSQEEVVEPGSENAIWTDEESTELHEACKRGDLVKAKRLGNEDITAIDENGWTPYQHAYFNGRVNIIKFLAEAHPTTNASVRHQMAYFKKSFDVTKKKQLPWLTQIALVKFSKESKVVTINPLFTRLEGRTLAPDKNGWTQELWLGHKAHCELVALLASINKGVSSTAISDWLTLSVACKKGDLDFVKYLVKEHPEAPKTSIKINRTSQATTPIEEARNSEQKEIVEFFATQK